MADAMTLDIRGVEEVERAFKRMKPNRANRIAVSALEQGANVIRVVERAAAPRGPKGNLKRGLTKKNAIVEAKHTPGVWRVKLRPDPNIAPHSHLVEWGTKDRRVAEGPILFDEDTGTVFGKSVAPMPASRFIQRSFNQAKGKAVAKIEDSLFRQVKREFERR